MIGAPASRRLKTARLHCFRLRGVAWVLALVSLAVVLNVALLLLRGEGGEADDGVSEAWDEAGFLRARAPRPWSSCEVPLPVPFSAQLPLSFPSSRPHNGRIPNIVHYLFGYKANDTTFNFVNFIAAASALAVLRPEAVYFHCWTEPTGFFWELIRPHVTLVQGRDVRKIFGNPIEHFAHKSDIVRLEALLEYGGIYLDVDVVTLRPFEPLMDADAAMGEEGENGRVGLCNAVILAKPNAPFVKQWYDSYRVFNQSQWNYHSVLLPMELAKKDPSKITALGYQTFHWPLWDAEGIRTMFDSFDYDYAPNKAVHVWNTGQMRSPYRNFSMAWCFDRCRSTLVSMFRNYVPDPLFSVVMPCFNQSQFIEEALASVARQRFPNWELLVVDDRSPDGCGEAAQRFAHNGGLGAGNEDRLRVLKNPQNLGLAESRNVGVRAAKGVWICALDADDRLGPRYLLDAAHEMSLNPHLGIIYSNQQFFGDSQWKWHVPVFDTGSATVRGPLPVMSLYLRSLWEKVGGYHSSLPWGNEDYDFWLSLLAIGARAHKLRGTHVFYRYKQHSMARDGQTYASEEQAMLRTRHARLYHEAKLLRDHELIMQMSDATRQRLLKLQARPSVSEEDKAFGSFWLALADYRHGRDAAALPALRRAAAVGRLSWQPALYEALVVCRSQGRGASAPLVEALARRFPALAATAVFQKHDRNCRGFAKWRPGPPARDGSDEGPVL